MLHSVKKILLSPCHLKLARKKSYFLLIFLYGLLTVSSFAASTDSRNTSLSTSTAKSAITPLNIRQLMVAEGAGYVIGSAIYRFEGKNSNGTTFYLKPKGGQCITGTTPHAEIAISRAQADQGIGDSSIGTINAYALGVSTSGIFGNYSAPYGDWYGYDGGSYTTDANTSGIYWNSQTSNYIVKIRLQNYNSSNGTSWAGTSTITVTVFCIPNPTAVAFSRDSLS